MISDFEPGDKVKIYNDSKVYDFGYYSQTQGMCVLYEEGEKNMQDSFAIDLLKIYKV